MANEKDRDVSLSWPDWTVLVMICVLLYITKEEIHKFRMDYQKVHNLPCQIGEH